MIGDNDSNRLSSSSFAGRSIPRDAIDYLRVFCNEGFKNNRPTQGPVTSMAQDILPLRSSGGNGPFNGSSGRSPHTVMEACATNKRKSLLSGGNR